MNSSEKSDCVINGVPYKCRCCFDPGRRIHSLADEADNEKTWRDLLKDVAQLQTKDDELLPKTVCSKCMEKLKSSHDFILQIHNVNNKYMQLLSGGNYPLQYSESYNDCLAESAIALPLELQEIKLEEELSYDMNLSESQQLDDNITAKSENEDDDPFTHTFDDDPKSPSDQLEDSESVMATSGECSTTKPNRRKKVVQSADGKKRTRKKLMETCKKPQKVKIKNTDDEDNNNEDGDDDDDDEFLKFDKMTNKCNICFKEFKNKSYVADHIRIVHEKLKPFKCSHCTKTFPTNTAKQLHEITHTGTSNYPFVCEYCEKRFRLLCRLRVHREIHTTKPELLCPICKRAQKTAKDFEEHVKSHDDSRLQCPSCGRLFRRAGQLNDHYNAVHLKLRPYKCAFCELGFGDRKTRRTHERIHRPKDRPIT